MRAPELKIPPTIVCLVVGVLMWLVARYWPLYPLKLAGRPWLAGMLAAGGTLVIAFAVAELRRRGTTLNPTRPNKSNFLVTSGVYGWTRNPMYLGLLLLLAGWALWLDSAPALIGVPLFFGYMSRFQIAMEERALAARFGTEFARYQSRVRRWL